MKASLQKLRIAEVPTTLSPDGRNRPPHLRSWRDGWRHLRFMLLYSPLWLFVVPGLLLLLLGLMGGTLLLGGPRTLAGVTFDIHSLLLSGFLAVLGYQVLVFGVFTRLFATEEGFLPEDPRLASFGRVLTLERGVLLGEDCAQATSW